VRRYGLLIFFAVLVVYLSFPTKNYYWDGISYAQDIEDDYAGPWYLHPNHLLYGPLGQQLWLASNAAGLNLRALTVLQMLSSVAGAATAALLFCILLESGASRYVASCLALGFAFSATWWKFATDADNYIVSTFLVTLCFWLLVRSDRSSPFVIGVVLCAAMLLHQLAVLFVPAATLALWSRSPREGAGRRLRDIVVFALTAAIPTAGMYVLVFYTQHDALQFREFMGWIVEHSQDSSFSFSVLHNAWISLVGHVRLVLGGNLKLVMEQRSPVSMVAGVALAVSLLILIRRLIQIPPTIILPMRDEVRRLLPVLALWCGTYVTFLIFWLPRNTFYRLFYLPALVVLCVPLLSGPRTKYNRLALGVAALFLLNFGFHIYPQSKPEANPNLEIAEQFRSILAPGDVVYWDVFAADNRTIRYFNPQAQWKELWSRPWTSLLEISLKEARAVWFDSVAFERLRQTDPEFQAWLLERADVGEAYEFPINDHVVGFVKLEGRRE
jgi:hypothetical protein